MTYDQSGPELIVDLPSFYGILQWRHQEPREGGKKTKKADLLEN